MTQFGPWQVGFRGQVIPLFIVQDIISSNWDGVIPPVLFDPTATVGYALSAAQGSAQFNGPVFFPIGDVTIGSPAATDAQLFIDNILQHLNLRETDDPDYPDKVFILDINGGIGRLLWADSTSGGPVFTTVFEGRQDGTLDIKGPVEREGLPAYLYKETVYFTSNDTFTKGDYDGLRAVRFKLQGGGQSGRGVGTTNSSTVRSGGGGASGDYVEGWVLESDLAATEAITIGQGGAGNTGAGNNGTDTVVDTISGELRAAGANGTAPQEGVGTTTPSAVVNAFGRGGLRADLGGSTGDLIIPGSHGETALAEGSVGRNGMGLGADSKLGSGGLGGNPLSAGNDGGGGAGYGSGGGGGFNRVSQGTARNGGDGADGIVIAEIYT